MSRHPDIRPRRSALYVPGSNARALEKARTLDADVLIFDIEDGVAPDRKEEARAQIIAALAQGGYDAELVIRINHPASRLGAADIKAAARSGAHAILLPKTEGAQEVRDAALRLASAGAPPTMALWAMIETPMGVMAGSGSNAMWHRAQDVLQTTATGTRYTVRGIDLERLVSEVGALSLGQRVRLRAPRIGVDATVSIVKLDYDFAATETLAAELGVIAPRLTQATVAL